MDFVLDELVHHMKEIQYYDVNSEKEGKEKVSTVLKEYVMLEYSV